MAPWLASRRRRSSCRRTSGSFPVSRWRSASPWWSACGGSVAGGAARDGRTPHRSTARPRRAARWSPFIVWLPPADRAAHEPRGQPHRALPASSPDRAARTRSSEGLTNTGLQATLMLRGVFESVSLHGRRSPGSGGRARGQRGRVRAAVLAARQVAGHGRRRPLLALVAGRARASASTPSPRSPGRSSSTWCSGSRRSASCSGSASGRPASSSLRSTALGLVGSHAATRSAAVVLLVAAVRPARSARCRGRRAHQREPRRAEQPCTVRLRADDAAARDDRARSDRRAPQRQRDGMGGARPPTPCCSSSTVARCRSSSRRRRASCSTTRCWSAQPSGCQVLSFRDRPASAPSDGRAAWSRPGQVEHRALEQG